MQKMNQRVQKSNMSFREKSSWLSIITILPAFGYYFVGALTSGGAYDTALVVKLLAAVVLFVLVQATGHGVLAAVFAKEVLEKPTELERRADLKAHRVAYYVLVVGVFAALALMLGGFVTSVGSFWLFNTVLFFFVLAELTKYGTEILYLRRAAATHTLSVE